MKQSYNPLEFLLLMDHLHMFFSHDTHIITPVCLVCLSYLYYGKHQFDLECSTLSCIMQIWSSFSYTSMNKKKRIIFFWKVAWPQYNWNYVCLCLFCAFLCVKVPILLQKQFKVLQSLWEQLIKIIPHSQD